MSTTTYILGPDGHPITSQQESPATSLQIRGSTISANPTVADAYGAPLDPGLRGGWMYADPTGRPSLRPGRYGVNRDAERFKCRSMYFLNPLFQGAVRIVISLLIGDAFSYGEVADKTARLGLTEFWDANRLGTLITERWMKEFFLDGENATVWPTGADDPGQDAPARVAFLDLDTGVTVEGDTALGTVASDMVRTVSLAQGLGRRTWNRGEFVWTASDALWNDPRGMPPFSAAAEAAMAYVGLGNLRLNVHELQQRIIAVYTAMVNPEEEDGGLAKWRQKGAAFRNVPPKGAVVPLVVKPGHVDAKGNRYDGVTETLEFPKPASGAADAAEDMSVFLRLVGLCVGGIPEHWLGEGGNVNRATAGEMSTPAVMLARLRQATLRSYLDRCVQTELERRWPGRTYRLPVVKVSADGLSSTKSYRYVRASGLEFPWQLPVVDEESLDTRLRVALAAAARGWVSDQTAAQSLGFDVPAEAEFMAATGRAFGTPSRPATTGPTPPPGPPPSAGSPGAS